jgi:signal transduction histidine kinase
VVVEDLGAETRFRITPVLRDHGVVSGVAVPVFSRGRAFGVLAVYSRRARSFSPDEVSLLQGLGNTLAAAIAQERAERMEQHAADIVASVAHDARAPLRTIDGFGRLLSEDCAGALGEQGRAHLAHIRAATARMQELIDGLLELARVTRGEPQRSPVDLSALAVSVAAELHDPARTVELVVAPDVQAHGDPRLLRIVLLNLLGNAWKYTGKRPRARIEFGATTADGATSYFVRDNGAGFDMAHADRLFAPFQRLHDAREFEGVGIGLATVERIIRHHGGRVWAESAPEQGATFYFTLGGSPP